MLKSSVITSYSIHYTKLYELDTSPLNEDGDPMRTANVKDGYALRNALNMGYHLAIITGGAVERVRLRYEKLGVPHIYMGVRDKIQPLNDFMEKVGVTADESYNFV